MPLVHHPGETWEYGIGIDWAGILLERASGTTLHDWIQTHITQPLQLPSITLFPTAAQKQHLASMHQRWPGSSSSSSVEERDHLYRAPLVASSSSSSGNAPIFHSGGAGGFAKPTEYAQLLAVLLNDGVGPQTGARILQPATVEEMFRNQIPHMPDFARRGIPAAKPEQTNPAPQLYPQEGDPPQGWGLSFMLTVEPGPTGRGANTAW
jgi:CubicO group peptidase (beta-lactamase class C family)